MVLIGLTTLLPAPVAAQETDAARAAEIYQLGVEAFEGEDFEAAAALFRRAWELDPNRRLAFNVARAYERGGNWESAREFYLVAREGASDDGFLARVDEALARVDDALAAAEPAPEPDPPPAQDPTPEPDPPPAQDPTPEPEPATVEGTLTASAGAPAARLSLDGVGSWELPASIELPAGSYEGRITAPGHRETPVTVWIEPGGLTRLDIAPQPVEPNRTRQIIGWSAVGSGALLGAAGLLFYSQASNRYDEATAIGRTGFDRGRFDDTVQAGRRNAALSSTFYGLGAASAIAGATLLGLELFGSGPESPRVSAGPAGVRLDWSF